MAEAVKTIIRKLRVKRSFKGELQSVFDIAKSPDGLNEEGLM